MKKQVRLFIGSFFLAYSFSLDREDGIRFLIGCGVPLSWVWAAIVGWNRWPWFSLGTGTRRIGIGEWQTDKEWDVQGYGPFWTSRIKKDVAR